MLKTAGLIVIQRDLSEVIPSKSNFVLEELKNIGFETQSVLYLPQKCKWIQDQLLAICRKVDVLIIDCLEQNEVFKALSSLNGQDMKTLQCTEKDLGDNSTKIVIPKCAKLLETSETANPVVYMQRIYVLNSNHNEKVFTEVVKPHLKQFIAPCKFSKLLEICSSDGSKFQTSNGCKIIFKESGGYGKLLLESSDFSKIVQSERQLVTKITSLLTGSKPVFPFKKLTFSDSHIKKTLTDVEKCFDLYGMENVFLSFNGGKDCTVLLHLALTVLYEKYDYKGKMLCMYVKSKNAFPEQDEFISQCETFYNLEVVTVETEIKEALEQVLKTKPNLKACLMGTRRTDPFSQNMNVFQMTDANWPQVMRVSPLLDWNFSDIWDYILFYKVPYCKLYDLGYTSLGNTINTVRNPYLRSDEVGLGEGKEEYLPAYKMLNETKERNGRNK